jgi:hypothetical protein
MRPAPAVAVSCNGGKAWRALQALLPAIAAAALTAFTLLHLELAAWPAWLLVAAAVGLLAWRLARLHQQLLRWDGQVWSVDGTPGALAVMIDIGPALLLRLRPEPRGAVRWIAVTQAEAASAWHALRAAVYSRPPKPTAPRVRPPERTAD